MNGTVDPVSPLPKRSTSPRPPTVGKEVKEFHENSWFQEPYKSYSRSMDDHRESPCGAGRAQDHQPYSENVAPESSDCKKADNLPNPSPPPPIKWAQSLLCLLEDLQGVSLFQQFLQHEGQDQDSRSLSFWFACNGVKKTDPTDKEGLAKLINVIYEKKVKRISAIRNETKEEIKHKLLSNTGVDATIFDTAQREVEAYIMKTTYPNFLKSDIYIQHLGGWQNESSTEKECASLPEVQLLPTVHEDSELNISSSNKLHLTKENLWQRNRIPVGTKLRAEGPSSLYLKSPYGNYGCYHSKYSSYLPASAQDSELQSLSSDAQTDDNMSLTDSSSVDYNMCSRNKQKRPQKAVRHNTFLNKDRLTHSSFIPRTQRLPQSMPPQSPKEFHEVLVKKLNKVLEEQKTKEKISEKLKIIEGNEGNQISNQRISHKSYTATVFDSILTGPSEENVQEILDKHCSRVFDGHSGQQSPAMMSPGCISPPTGLPPPKLQSELPEFCHPPASSCINYEHMEKLVGIPSGYPYSCSQVPPFTVPCNVRHRRDHDVHSNDSGAMVDCTSDDSISAYFKGHGYFSSTGSMEMMDHAQFRRSRELKRNASKKFSSMTDSSSSCVDSGISVACESVPPSYSKVTHWLETKRYNSDQEREHVWKNSSSPVLSRSSSSRKPVIYNCSRSGMLDSWQYAPPQPFMQDSSLPTMQQVPDTTSNLIEARRILEVENRTKMKTKSTSSRNSHDTSRMKFSKACDSVDDCLSHRKQSRKSCPGTVAEGVSASNPNNDLTVIGYSFGRDAVPYLSKLPGKSITLKQFKTLLSKKGDYRYFFKKARDDFGTGVVFEEVTEDYEILPLWEGKVFCVIETIDESST